jgi:DNA-binding CsgD family transcriptional regulator
VGSGGSTDDQPPQGGGDEPALSESAQRLTDVQRRILVLLCEPYTGAEPEPVPASNKVIASALFISVDTVRTHLRALYRRFDIAANLSSRQKRHRLAMIAVELGLTAGDDATTAPPAPAPAAPRAPTPGTTRPDAAADSTDEVAPPQLVTAAPAAPPAPRDRGDDRGGRGGRGRGALVAGIAVVAVAGVVTAIVLGAGGASTNRGEPAPATTAATVAAATPPTVPANVLVLLDTSATMRLPLDPLRPQDGTRLEVAQDFVAGAVENSPDPDHIGVWLFGGSRADLPAGCRRRPLPCDLQPLVAATDHVRSSLRPRLMGLRAGGTGTPPYAVIGRGVLALRAVDSDPGAVSSVVVITDGAERAGQGRVSALAAARRDDRIKVFIAGAGDHFCDGALERAVRRRFPGSCYEVTTLREAEAALAAILQAVRTPPARSPAAAGGAQTGTATTRAGREAGGARPPATRGSPTCADDRIRVPNVVGMVHQLAQDTMQAAGLPLLAERDATGQGRWLIFDRDWTTVGQHPAAGSCVTADTTILLVARRTDE